MTSVKANEATNTEEQLDELKRCIEQTLTQIDDAYEHITRAFAKGEALDPRNLDHTGRRDTFYRFLYNRFRNKPLEDVTIPFFIQIWHALQFIQKDENIPIYDLDAVATILSDAFSSIWDKGASMRWRLASVASEVFRNEELSSPVRKRISKWHGVPPDAMNRLESIALKNHGVVTDGDNWSIPEAFPEDSVRQFLETYQGNDVLFAHRTPRDNEFPLSTVYFGSLLEKMNRVTDPLGRGQILEDLATYLTLLVPGWIPERNVVTTHKEFESDIVVSDHTQASNLLDAEHHILVECKNWAKPVGVQDVGYFLYRMILSRTKYGILFASNGITGDSKKLKDQNNVRRAAASLIVRAFDRNDIICIVLKTEDLHALKGGCSSFRTMIRKKAKEVPFGKSLRTS